MESYCKVCQELVSYDTEEEMVKEDVMGEEINYSKRYDVCRKCGNRFYSEETYNQNVINSSNALREKNSIITTTQIEEILKKYNIGKKPLSLVLGWGEITIIRYLDGQMPERVYSDILFKILEDPKELLKYVEKNKELITSVAYKKVVGRIAEIRLEEDRSKIYLIAKHIIARMGDITPLALQKILYYIQGFSLALYNREMFNDRCEAWVHGPVYREIYDRFAYYSYNSIDSSEFDEYKNINLNEEEQKLVDEISNDFGCYSGKTLEKMTHYSLPWTNAREGIDENEASNKEILESDMTDYFKDVILKYNITSVEDIAKYSREMFKKVSKI